ncbi:MAG: hypothetical protein DCF29_12860 [Alphaproteobacteria bacterium]|nr:MAG: hypothetical protein DCF29_12860 [Alphaproteobacteria bacterium]
MTVLMPAQVWFARWVLGDVDKVDSQIG